MKLNFSSYRFEFASQFVIIEGSPVKFWLKARISQMKPEGIFAMNLFVLRFYSNCEKFLY